MPYADGTCRDCGRDPQLGRGRGEAPARRGGGAGGGVVSAHRHRAIPGASTVRTFTGPVRADQDRRAHGGVCFIDTCRCGAQRRTNTNRMAVM